MISATGRAWRTELKQDRWAPKRALLPGVEQRKTIRAAAKAAPKPLSRPVKESLALQ